ncbi:hypothetical protein GGR57DRAFT_502994 [Xylariaceae sp. FL1272]|nr:hypothetical protein GGR57DRAFT_502994 [Xylariaceae sp. FL1272]
MSSNIPPLSKGETALLVTTFLAHLAASFYSWSAAPDIDPFGVAMIVISMAFLGAFAIYDTLSSRNRLREAGENLKMLQLEVKQQSEALHRLSLQSQHLADKMKESSGARPDELHNQNTRSRAASGRRVSHDRS